MKRKQVFAVMMALAIASSVGLPSIKAEAAGLTQASSASVVNYGTLSDADVALLRGFFDVEYYKTANPEVVEVLGDDPAILFEHFCKCGIFEGRTCNANFDPSAYASAYADELKESFGNDYVKYYEHYLTYGITEGRTLTTLEACANAGITVTPLSDDSFKITPAVYLLAKRLGTNDFKTVQAAVSAAKGSSASSGGSSSGGSVINVGDDGYLIVEDGGDADAYAKANGLEKIGELKVEDGQTYKSISIYIVKGEVGYAAYDNFYVTEEEFAAATPLAHTEGYVAPSYYNLVTTVSVSLNSLSEYDGESDFDLTNVPFSEFEGTRVSTTEDNTQFTTINVWDNNQYSVDQKESATDYESETGKYILKGYYTNADGTEKHIFATNEERDEWAENNNVYISDTEVTNFNGIDVDGTSSTSYDVGLSLEENDDGSLTVTVGVSNDENKYGHVATATVTEKEPEEDSENLD